MLAGLGHGVGGGGGVADFQILAKRLYTLL